MPLQDGHTIKSKRNCSSSSTFLTCFGRRQTLSWQQAVSLSEAVRLAGTGARHLRCSRCCGLRVRLRHLESQSEIHRWRQ
eukprot:symbB.v1.2.011129.t1/scaffold732.1/size241626/3